MKLFLKEIADRYIQENFKKLQKEVSALSSAVSGGNTTYVNTTERIPLDGTEPISGTIEPDTAGTHDIGSVAKPLRGLYSDEVYVGASTLYVDDRPAVGYNSVNGRMTYSSEGDGDVEVKATGTGTLYIDAEGDISITSSGIVTVNGDAVANYSFGRDRIDVATQIINGNQAVLAHTPIENSETVALNGQVLTDGASYDYTISGNVLTFNSGVLTPTGLLRIVYNY